MDAKHHFINKDSFRNLIKQKSFIITSIVVGAVLLILAIILIIIELDRRETLRLDAESVVLRENLTVSYGQSAQVSDFLAELQGELVDNFSIDTNTLGQQEINFEYINIKNRKRPAKFTIEIVDTTKPRIYGSTAYTLPVNYAGDLTSLMLSGDDLDDHPTREIIGDYDLTTPGTYHLTYQITDSYDNQATQDFTLNIIQPNPNQTTPSPETEKMPIVNAIKQYKTADTQIGIDVSQWQGDEINWSAVKAAGVEFVMVRLGYQYEFDGDYILDPYFATNVEGAQAAGLLVGAYFYSYAHTRVQAIDQAEWILEQIKPYDLELGVAFDWECWGEFNAAGMSFQTINAVANDFLQTIEENGYTGMLYSSKIYLERIWSLDKYPVWLAQYYHKPTYEGEFTMWQLSSSGRVPGIYGDVDLDIRYLK